MIYVRASVGVDERRLGSIRGTATRPAVVRNDCGRLPHAFMVETLKRTNRAPLQRPPIMPLLPTIEEEDKLSWLRLMWRYRLQFQAMASPSLIMMAGGMKVAWSVFEAPPSKLGGDAHTHLLASAWFMGVIWGALISATFVQHRTKNAAYCTAGALLLLGGFLFAVLPTRIGALIFACCCEGCAFGLAQVQMLVTGAEVAHKDIRGLLLSFERTALWFGICLQLMCTRLWFEFEPAGGYALHPSQLQGMTVACLGIAATALAWLHRLESPLLLQVQQRDCAATWTLKQLHGIRSGPSSDLLRMRDDYKQLTLHDDGLTRCEILWQRNALPLLKVMLLRCFVALSMSLPLNRTFLTLGWGGLNCDMNCAYLLAFSGLIGSCAGGLLIDAQGRRRLTVMTLLLSGIFIFLAGGIIQHIEVTNEPAVVMDLEMAAYMMLLHQFFVSVGSSIASSVYAAEAFTLAMKAKCIAAMTACEHFLLIALAATAFHVEYKTSVLFFSMGSLSLLFGLFVFLFMPETKFLTLNECLLKFRRLP